MEGGGGESLEKPAGKQKRKISGLKSVFPGPRLKGNGSFGKVAEEGDMDELIGAKVMELRGSELSWTLALVRKEVYSVGSEGETIATEPKRARALRGDLIGFPTLINLPSLSLWSY